MSTVTSESYIQFSKGLDSHIQKTFAGLLKKSTADDQAFVAKHLQIEPYFELDGSLINSEIRIKTPPLNSPRTILKYAILSWYLPDLSRFYLQEKLLQQTIRNHFWQIRVYLRSQKDCRIALLAELDYKLNDIFGNILQPGVHINRIAPDGSKYRENCPDLIKIGLQRPNRPKRTIRRRGYKDHGSLPDASTRAIRKGLQEDENLRLEQLKIELQRAEESSRASIRELQIWILSEGID
jgi:hypothetical protein